MKLTILASVAALAALVAGHVSIINPCPRYSPVGENCPALPPGQSLDTGSNAINGPISSVQLGGTMPLCRHTTPYATPSAKWTAGQSVTIKFNPSAAIHSGGHCEFSMSYDNGKTFAVIHRELQYCFLGSKPASLTNTAAILSYTFNLPADLPSSDTAVFSWSWVNASGNREYYMNCADVSISGSSSGSFTGPQMVVANYPGYPTIPEFNGDYTTGMQYYTNAPNITVSPSGGNGGNGGQPPASPNPNPVYSSAVVTSAAYPAPTAPAAPVSSAPPMASPTYASSSGPVPHDAKNGSGACSTGALQCAGSGYQVCISGVWSQTYSCGSGTTCKGSGGSIYCDWP